MSMRPKDLVRLPKVVIEAGSWKVVTGRAKMPTTAFPLSKNFSVQLGRNYHWRVDVVRARDVDYRILTAYQPDFEEYRSWLAVPRGNAHTVVAQLEFHGTHPGWHCHIACCDVDDVEVGQGHPRSAMRFPGGNNKHRRLNFDMTDSVALAKAFNFFSVTGAPEGAMV
jgi:hypothetical protein